MPGLLQQFGLGLKGVNRVSNPIDLKDGELRLAQNAALSTKRGRAALLKRPGVGMLVDTTLSSGSILAIMPLPFADPDPGTLITPGYPPWPIIPDVPVVTAPFTWEAVPGATGYIVRVANDAGMTDIVIEQDVGDVTTADVGADPGTYWVVEAYNGRGPGEPSEPEPTPDDEGPPASGGWSIGIDAVGAPLMETITADAAWTLVAGATIDLEGHVFSAANLPAGLTLMTGEVNSVLIGMVPTPNPTVRCEGDVLTLEEGGYGQGYYRWVVRFGLLTPAFLLECSLSVAVEMADETAMSVLSSGGLLQGTYEIV